MAIENSLQVANKDKFEAFSNFQVKLKIQDEQLTKWLKHSMKKNVITGRLHGMALTGLLMFHSNVPFPSSAVKSHNQVQLSSRLRHNPLRIFARRGLSCVIAEPLSLPQVRTILLHLLSRNSTCSQSEALKAGPLKILVKHFTAAWRREIRVAGLHFHSRFTTANQWGFHEQFFLGNTL